MSEKTNDPILRKFSGRQADGQANRNSRVVFIGRCPTNVERPKAEERTITYFNYQQNLTILMVVKSTFS